MKLTLRPAAAALFAIASTILPLLISGLAAEPPKITAKAPAIPQRSFSITDFGAVGDGTTMNTAAFHTAIDACAKAGGGSIVVPAGSFLTAPFELQSAMDLHLMKGATVKMSPRVEDYPVTKHDRLSFITATEAKDVQISGEGTIDGQGEAWWAAILKAKGTAASTAEPRRPQMIAFTRCERVKLEGVTTLNPPNTHCSLRQCKEVTIEGLTMLAPADAPNTDALNLNIRNAVIRDCQISTGDDNIVFLASTSNKEGTPAVENVAVSNCKLGTGHGLSFGSYTSGGIRNVTVDHVSFEGTTSGIRLKAARDRGGLVENLLFKEITMKNVKYPIYVTSYYPKEPSRPDEDASQPIGAQTPQWRNITIEDGTISDCPNSIVLWALPEQPVTGFTLRNLRITSERGAVVYYAKDVRFENVDLHVEKGAALTTFDAQVEGMEATPLAPPATKRELRSISPAKPEP